MAPPGCRGTFSAGPFHTTPSRTTATSAAPAVNQQQIIAPGPRDADIDLLAKIKEGWCSNWQIGAGGDQHYFTNHTTHAAYWERDGASCFARCDATAACKQAVFETREGYWGPQCWLGTNHVPHAKMSNRPTCQDTPGCQNFCYAKMGVGYEEPIEESRP